MENLSWAEQFLLGGVAVMVVYAAFNLLALTWRLSNRVLAQAQLYEAQAKYYEARADYLEEQTRHLAAKDGR